MNFLKQIYYALTDKGEFVVWNELKMELGSR